MGTPDAPERTLAEARLRMNAETVRAVAAAALPKGDPLVTARYAAACEAPGVAIDFELEPGAVRLTAFARAGGPPPGAAAARRAVCVAALAIYDVCKSMDKGMALVWARTEAGPPAGAPGAGLRPRAGVIVLSDRVARGEARDRSGAILREGLAAAGCPVERFTILPDEGTQLHTTLLEWIAAGVRLIVTTGGTGVGPRDVTVDTVEALLTRRLPGVEQALHARGRESAATAMFSRLLAGLVGDTVVVCLPGSPGAVRDGLAVLVPAVLHLFDVLEGARHP